MEHSLSYRPGTLSSLLDLFVKQDDGTIDSLSINIFLYTYRLHWSASVVLSAVDKKFWNACTSVSLTDHCKIKAVSSIKTFISCWLESPHLNDFDKPPNFSDLTHLVVITTRWYYAFSAKLKHLVDSDPSRTSSGSLERPAVVRRLFSDSLPSFARQELANDLKAVRKKAHRILDRWQRDARRDDKSGSSETKPYPKRSVHDRSQHSRQRSTSTAASSNEVHEAYDVEYFEKMDAVYVADQLTAIDQEIFLKLWLPDCLTYARGKSSPTVEMFIAQFNQTFRLVQTTLLTLMERHYHTQPTFDRSRTPSPGYVRAVRRSRSRGAGDTYYHLSDSNGKSRYLNVPRPFPNAYNTAYAERRVPKRAQLLAKWITIAWELRQLKNFFSLKAVITALESHPIYRLQQCWKELEICYEKSLLQFRHMRSLVSVENNQKKARELLDNHMRQLADLSDAHQLDIQLEGTAKYAICELPAALQDWDTREETQLMATGQRPIGTIPFLGIFLSDLTVLNEAATDYVKPVQFISTFPTTPTQNTNRNAELVQGPLRIRKSDTTPVIERETKPGLKRTDASNSKWLQNPFTLVENSRKDQLAVIRKSSQSSTNAEQRNASTTNEDKMVNFDKHRREFAVLARLSLLQHSAKLYNLKSDSKFRAWFDGLPKFTDKQAQAKSGELEPEMFYTWSHHYKPQNITTYGTPSESNSSSGTGSSSSIPKSNEVIIRPYSAVPRRSVDQFQALAETNGRGWSATSFHCSPCPPPTLFEKSVPSIRSVHLTADPSRPYKQKKSGRTTPVVPSMLPVPQLNSRLSSSMSALQRLADDDDGGQLRIHITLEESVSSQRNLSILNRLAILGSQPYLAGRGCDDHTSIIETVTPKDRVREVLARALNKFNRDREDATNYHLVQIRKGQPELVLPDNANVFYALCRPTGTQCMDSHQALIECLCRRRSDAPSLKMNSISATNLKSSSDVVLLSVEPKISKRPSIPSYWKT